MALTGNLSTMLPGDLLQWLSLGQKTGTLVVTNRRVEKKIFFKAGRVISSATNDPREYLGQFLMSHGYLTEPELKKAMEVQLQSGILLGKILVMIDVITEQDLQRLMRLKAEEEIYDIFLWNDGDFYKWLEAAIAAYAVTKDPGLEQAINTSIAAITAAQREDGAEVGGPQEKPEPEQEFQFAPVLGVQRDFHRDRQRRLRRRGATHRSRQCAHR